MDFSAAFQPMDPDARRTFSDRGKKMSIMTYGVHNFCVVCSGADCDVCADWSGEFIETM